jgi:crotonobetainyl-CoA:carnitine CoA-transferase CaiB-like acyl-CoA transferase
MWPIAQRPPRPPPIPSLLPGPTRAGVIDRLQAAGVPAGPVNNLAEAFEFARTLNLDSTWDIDGVTHVRTPMSMSLTPPHPSAPPPWLDESGDAVRAWLAAAAADETDSGA